MDNPQTPPQRSRITVARTAKAVLDAEKQVCRTSIAAMYPLNEADNVTDLATAVDALATVLDTTVR